MVDVRSLGSKFSSISVPTSAGVRGRSSNLGGSYITVMDSLTLGSLPLLIHKKNMKANVRGGKRKIQFSVTSMVQRNFLHPEGTAISPLSHPKAIVRPSPIFRGLFVTK